MPAIFNTILIPVDFSINTEVAVKKCLEIIEPVDSRIIMLHAETKKAGWRLQRFKNPLRADCFPLKYYFNEKQRKLFEWRSAIEESLPGVRVEAKIVKASNVGTAIVEESIQAKPDVIIIGKNCRHSNFPFLNTVSSNEIAKATGVPVLTVKPGSIYNRVKSVVVPIGSSVPRRKVELIIALRKRFRISVHLVTLLRSRQNANDFSGYALLDTYRFLRDVANCPLDHEVLHGDNIARSSLKYAEQIKADMLLVDPEKETRLTSFPGKYISDELMPDSRLQILTVQP
jgi:hypothetical protein